MQESLQATWSECYKKKKLRAAIDDGGGSGSGSGDESQREWVLRKG
jgi:hypothetical protein